MLVSIIIPLFNKESSIKDTIISVLNQSHENIEIIIINDGSTDNSLGIVSKFKDFRIKVFNQTNQGVSSARNLGIKHSNGEFISFLDADDYFKVNINNPSIVWWIRIIKRNYIYYLFININFKNTIFTNECNL